jgi:tetratricopeptide (TPR) repeat protein
MMTTMKIRFRQYPILTPVLLLFGSVSCFAQLEIKIKQDALSPDSDPVLVVSSEALGSVPYSFTGLGAIRSGALVAGSSKTYTYTKTGVVQYKIGRGEAVEKGMVPLKRGTRIEVSLAGLFAEPSVPSPATPSAAPEFQFQPASDGSMSIRHPYGAAFEQLSADQKIRMVEESPLTAQLASSDKQKLLGFLYNEKGVQAANERRFAEAETALLQSLKLIPSHPAVTTNLAFAIAAQGKDARASGDSRKAQTRLQDSLNILGAAGNAGLASQVRTALASVYVEEAQALSGSNEPSAVSLFKRALDQDPAHPIALFELGKRAYADYDLKTALQYFEAAYHRAPQKELADLIEKVKVELDEAGEFVTEDRGDFKISFEGREVKSIAKTVRDLLSDAQREVGRKLGLRPKGTIPVVIYSGGQFQKILGLHSWAGGAYDGKIRLPISDLTDQDLRVGAARIRELVFHEYTHALLHDRAASARIPIWFHEGVAQLAADQNPTDGGQYRQMTNAVLGGFIPPPSEMTGDFASVPDAGEARILYLASYSFIRFLLEEHGGWSRLRKAVDRLVSGESVGMAIDSAYRESLVDLENEWMDKL